VQKRVIGPAGHENYELSQKKTLEALLLQGFVRGSNRIRTYDLPGMNRV